MADIDPNDLKQFSFLLFSKLEGAITSAMVYLGQHLGLYQALAAAAGPLSSDELAAVTGLHERWVREWASNQAAAKLVSWQEGTPLRFSLSPAAAAVLADPNHPAYGMGMFAQLPATMSQMEWLPNSFRSGIGYDYDHHGPVGAAGIEVSFAPWYRNYLVSVALPALDGVVAKLEGGAVVADVGCGGGLAIALMAERFPESQFHGFDISEHALDRARRRKDELGLPNAHFHNPQSSDIAEHGPFDLVTTFDCIHDMTQPTAMVNTLRSVLRPDGTWLLADMKGRNTFAENVAKNPMASLMYGISVMSCMASGLSEPGGEGLGTLGLTATKAEQMARAAGFTQFRKLAIDHATNAFFEIRV